MEEPKTKSKLNHKNTICYT